MCLFGIKSRDTEGQRRKLVGLSGKALGWCKQKDLGSIRFGSPFSSKVVVYGRLSSDFAHIIDERLKCLTQLPALMLGHSGGDSVASRW